MLQPRITGSLLLMTPEKNEALKLPPSYTYHAFHESQLDILKQLMVKLLSSLSNIHMNSSYCKYKFITVNGVKVASSSNRNLSIIMANKFTGTETEILGTREALRPCKVNQFIKVSYSVNDTICTHCFAVVSWYQEHPQQHRMGKPVQVWCKDSFEVDDMHTYLSLSPPNVIKICRCIHTVTKLSVNSEEVLVVVPIVS